MNYTVVDAQRQQIGPITEQRVRELFEQGVITLESLAWKPGMDQWQPLRSFSEFIDVANPPDSSSVPAPESSNPYAPPSAQQYFPSGEGSLDMNLTSAERARALTAEILQRDFSLDITGCISRAWNLVFSRDFWPIVGVNTLTCLTLLASSMCYANIVITGPVTGGVYLYFLKKIRREEATLNIAFSGFSLAFSQLFLAFLVSSLISGVGVILLIIPGIYLMVAYFFTYALVLDKKLEFWDAMECSRKVVTRHWFPVFGLLILAGLLAAVGVVALCVGMLVTMPIYHAAMMYAYEDIFNPGNRGRAV